TAEGVPMVDTWWQSETGSTIISPRQTDTTFKPGAGSRPLPGVNVAVVDDNGDPTEPNKQGGIVVTRPGPGAGRTVWGKPKRFCNAYWQDFCWDEDGRGWFLAGDGAKVADDDDIGILVRMDDVINISGHRLSTIDIESALVSHPNVIE